MEEKNAFEKFIDRIDNDIAIFKGDRQTCSNDFDIIRTYLLEKMQAVCPIFKKIYGGPTLSGSYIGTQRVGKLDEFDTYFVLKLPFYEDIKVEADLARPGFVRLSLSTVLPKMRNEPEWNDVCLLFETFVNEQNYLCRNKVYYWLQSVIDLAIITYGSNIQNSTGDTYKIVTQRKATTGHTIRGCSNTRKILIEFFPAFKFKADCFWLADREFPDKVKEKRWLAVPKSTVGPKTGRQLIFNICVPQIEKELLLNMYNLKPSLRLFKSLRNKLGGSRMKNHFIKSLYLYELENQDNEFWKNSTGFLLLHMVDKMVEYLKGDSLPFYWSPKQNLLNGLETEQVRGLKYEFMNIKITLDSWYHLPNISYPTVRRLFGTTYNGPLKSERI